MLTAPPNSGRHLPIAAISFRFRQSQLHSPTSLRLNSELTLKQRCCKQTEPRCESGRSDRSRIWSSAGPRLEMGSGPQTSSVQGAGSQATLQSRITLYTGNTYFLWPQLKFSGILRPFDEYRELLSIVAIYDFRPDLPERVTNLEVIAHETWRLASSKRASATREYIGSIQDIGQLKAGDGEFGSPEEFYRYWRSTSRDWKKSPEAEKLLRRALEDSD